AYTFFATAGCIARLGATPLLVDVDPITLNLSPTALTEFLRAQCERKDGTTFFRKTGQPIRAVVPVHLFGTCCEMDPIEAVSREYRLDVIEDAAQALGAEYPSSAGTRRAGSMGKAGSFSFYPSKNLGAAGDAGAIVCQEPALAEKLRVL